MIYNLLLDFIVIQFNESANPAALRQSEVATYDGPPTLDIVIG